MGVDYSKCVKEYEDGSMYKGQFYKGQFHGKGALRYGNGTDLVDGQWRHGQLHGW